MPANDEPARQMGQGAPLPLTNRTPFGTEHTEAQGLDGRTRAQSLSSADVDLGEMRTATEGASGIQNGKARMRSQGPPPAAGYEDLEPLGAGTYGEVWKAREQGTGIAVAIKFFVHTSGPRWELLQEEVRQLAQLDSVRGIVQLKDVCPDASPPYYVMAFADRGSLAERLEEGPLPAGEAVALFRQVAEGLAYVHAKGIRHCDLKPGNVLLDARGQALIADFGQAHLGSDSTPALGTFFYMAPEQADLKCQMPDTRWDVYGLGALLHVMLTGTAPRHDEGFRRELAGTADLSHRLARYREWILRAPPPRAHRRVAGVDGDLAEIVERCLEIDPARRLRDAGAVLAALARRERRRRQRPLWVFALIAPLLLLGLMDTVEELARSTAVKTHRASLDKQLLDKNRQQAQLIASGVQERLQERRERTEKMANAALYKATVARDAKSLAGLVTEGLLVAPGKPSGRFFYGTVCDDRGKIITAVIALTKEGKSAGTRNEFETVKAFYPAEPSRYALAANYSWRDWFSGKGERYDERKTLHAPIRRPHVSVPFVSKLDDVLFVALSVPIRDPDDPNAEPVGVLSAGISVKQLNEWLKGEGNRDGEGGGKVDFPVLLSQKQEGGSRYFVQHPDKRSRPEREKGPPAFDLSRLEAELAKGELSGTIREYQDPVDGKVYQASFARMDDPGLDWVVLVQHDPVKANQQEGPLRAELDRIRFLALAAAGTLVVLLWGWLYWLLRRSERLSHA